MSSSPDEEIVHQLLRHYPDAKIALRFSNPLELLIATILSAQCTDQRVNEVTRDLFQRYRSAKDYVDADPAELEALIRPTGYYRNKARAIKRCCETLVERFGGNVPGRLEELVQLPGVGRKTANIVLACAFDRPAIAVDTHVFRVSKRLGLAKGKRPEEVEQELMARLPREVWRHFFLAAILHGREICKARNPACGECFLRSLCPWEEKVKYLRRT